MPKQIGVLVVHGMGSQTPGYSTGMRDEVTRRLGDLGPAFKWREVYWADALEGRERDLFDCMQHAADPGGNGIDLDFKKVRKFVVHNFGDALAYHRESGRGSAYEIIHKTVSAEIGALKASLAEPEAPVVVMAHSLGAHIMSNYLWDRQHAPKLPPDRFNQLNSLIGMITFGCNIPLFSLAFPVARPFNLPGSAIRKTALKAVSRWLNLLDVDDVLGWPLAPLYRKNIDKLNKKQVETLERIEDYEVNVGSIIANWNPVSHGSYWTDNDFTRPVAEYLKEVARALE